MQRISITIIAALSLFTGALHAAQTIAEKKAGISRSGDLSPEMQKQLVEANKNMSELRTQLQSLYAEVQELFNAGADSFAYADLLRRIQNLREEMLAIQAGWGEVAVRGSKNDSYALWHSPETTLERLVVDYGSQSYVYMIPPDIAEIRLSVDSSLPIPRACWDEMLELILAQNGVGIQQLNPYLRSLYFLRENKSDLRLITNKRSDLQSFSAESRVCFMLSPEPMETRRIWSFLEKFSNPNSMVLQMVGRDIFIIGRVKEVTELLKLYDFAAVNKGDKEYKVIPLFKVEAEEMARILAAIFDQVEEDIPLCQREAVDPAESRRSLPIFSMGPDSNGLKVIALSDVARAIFLVGTREEIRQAEEIVRQVECQVSEAREKIVHWYNVKHANPEELADILYKIYLLMTKPDLLPGPGSGMEVPGSGDGDTLVVAQPVSQDVVLMKQPNPLLPSELYQKNFYQQGAYVVNPAPVEPMKQSNPPVNVNRDNFIVDPKTGSLVMVVEADILPRIKEIVRRMDVPAKMVQLEVLLFEVNLRRQNNFGLNLLKIGDCASNTHSTCAVFNDLCNGPFNLGIFSFLMSRKKSSIPAYDLAYQFLMGQQDVQINANPSVVTMNQTPARIAVVDEISLDTGIYNVETAKGVTLEKAFTRAQYGININITPTIHTHDDEEMSYEDEPDYVTLVTNVTFDTPDHSVRADRPNITRRNVVNTVRIPDGQTVIIGGLRKKDIHDTRDSIPFIGELPGIGKLFSDTRMEDCSTDMYIFITPKIISDPATDFEYIRCEEMKRRPGDIPEFMCCMVAAREAEKHRLMQGSMQMLFGRPNQRCYNPGYWNDPIFECCDGR